MDAKSKADFINSVASGTNVPCHKCGASNKPASRFCVFCGEKIDAPQETQSSAIAFKPTQEAIPVTTAKYVESNNVFAQGLPDWSVEPPQMMVRRR